MDSMQGLPRLGSIYTGQPESNGTMGALQRWHPKWE